MKSSKYLVFAALGFELVGIIIAMVIIGQYLDEKMQWPGYSLAGFLLFGLVGWMIHIIILAKALEKSSQESE